MPSVYAQILIHTDNQHDLASFMQGEMRSLSSATNLLALAPEEHDIEFVFVPLKRSLQFMKKGEPICVINKIKTTKREKQFIFSAPINLFLSRRLYQYADLDFEKMAIPVSFDRLFEAYPNRKLIISDQISYGNKLDALIDGISNHNKIIRRGASHSSGILDMFREQRGDYVLLFPLELSNTSIEKPILSFEIAGIEPYIVGRLMCVDSAKTRRFIQHVNKRINALNLEGKLLQAHLNYYPKKIHSQVTNYLTEEFKVTLN
jgi:uncharacterized protein (TIGR02285 family)